MQRIIALVKVVSNIKTSIPNGAFKMIPSFFSTVQNPIFKEKLLLSSTPLFSQVCSFKVKGRVKRRCKDCYIVVRDQRSYVICPKFPRHKQMAMKAKPLNTWVLTHATQSPVRAW